MFHPEAHTTHTKARQKLLASGFAFFGVVVIKVSQRLLVAFHF